MSLPLPPFTVQVLPRHSKCPAISLSAVSTAPGVGSFGTPQKGKITHRYSKLGRFYVRDCATIKLIICLHRVFLNKCWWGCMSIPAVDRLAPTLVDMPSTGTYAMTTPFEASR